MKKKAPRTQSLGYRYVRLLRCSNEAIVVRVVLAALAIFALQWRIIMSKPGLAYVYGMSPFVCLSPCHVRLPI